MNAPPGHPQSPHPPELVPGNFYRFPFFIALTVAGVEHLGYPKVCLRNTLTGAVHWGSSVEWSWPDPSKPRVPWV